MTLNEVDLVMELILQVNSSVCFKNQPDQLTSGIIMFEFFGQCASSFIIQCQSGEGERLLLTV